MSTDILPETTLPGHGGKRSSEASDPYREMIELEPSKGRNTMNIWQDLVDKHGFTSSYQSVQRFVLKLRGAVSPDKSADSRSYNTGGIQPAKRIRRTV